MSKMVSSVYTHTHTQLEGEKQLFCMKVNQIEYRKCLFIENI